MKRNCKAKFFALLNSSICHDVRQRIDLSLLRRWLLRRALMYKLLSTDFYVGARSEVSWTTFELTAEKKLSNYVPLKYNEN